MSVFLVTWDLNRKKANYTEARQRLIDHMSRYSHIKDPDLDSVWFIQSSASPDVLDADIRQHMASDDRIIVTQLVKGQHQGWLAKDVWDWINARL